MEGEDWQGKEEEQSGRGVNPTQGQPERDCSCTQTRPPASEARISLHGFPDKAETQQQASPASCSVWKEM